MKALLPLIAFFALIAVPVWAEVPPSTSLLQENALSTFIVNPAQMTPIAQLHLQGLREHAREWTEKLGRRIFFDPATGLFSRMLFTFPFWIALMLTLVLERVMPAEPNRKLFGRGFRQDLMWFFYEPFLHSLIVATYVSALAKLYNTYFTHLTFAGLNELPGLGRFVLALLLVDLGFWVQHYINHKVPFLWRMHALHHAQRELNFFTDFRYHPFEYIVRHTFITLPFLWLSIDLPVIVAFAVVKEWYSRFYHGNIRTNLGPLKYILVTPQSHRIHHSLEPRHHDLNFGAIFSFWDFLFGKQYRGFDEYPATGIPEEDEEHEEESGFKEIVLAPWRQMVRAVVWRRRVAEAVAPASASSQSD